MISKFALCLNPVKDGLCITNARIAVLIGAGSIVSRARLAIIAEGRADTVDELLDIKTCCTVGRLIKIRRFETRITGFDHILEAEALGISNR